MHLLACPFMGALFAEHADSLLVRRGKEILCDALCLISPALIHSKYDLEESGGSFIGLYLVWSEHLGN